MPRNTPPPSRRAVRTSPTGAVSTPAYVRVGIGGWNYAPWHETFYPPGTAPSAELDYASRQVTSIEVNGTFYRLQKPEVYAKWRDSTPPGFIFSLKAPRFIVQRDDLRLAGAAVERFLSSGLSELGPKLGPILWQLPPTKIFDAGELGGFLSLLPATVDALPLRHALEVRHPSFLTPAFVELLRRQGVAAVCADDATYPGFSDLTATFVYARLRRSRASVRTGYPLAALRQWSHRVQLWANGGTPSDLPRIAREATKTTAPREVFLYFINGAKERNPAAARALIDLLAEPRRARKPRPAAANPRTAPGRRYPTVR